MVAADITNIDKIRIVLYVTLSVCVPLSVVFAEAAVLWVAAVDFSIFTVATVEGRGFSVLFVCSSVITVDVVGFVCTVVAVVEEAVVSDDSIVAFVVGAVVSLSFFDKLMYVPPIISAM